VSWSTLFLIALVLACPLMMVFMHRGGHGGHGHGGGSRKSPSLDVLRQRRNELDAQIAALEEPPEPDPEPDPEPEPAEEAARPAAPVAP